MRTLFIFILCKTVLSLNWQITPITHSKSPPLTSTVKFRVMLNNVEQTTGKLAMVDSKGLIRGLAESPLQEAKFLGGKWYFSPLNFKSENEGTDYNIMFTPDNHKIYNTSSTYKFISHDPAKTEINFKSDSINSMLIHNMKELITKYIL